MAQVVDLNSTKPIKGEKYFIDTNVWFWTTYVASKDMSIPNAPEDYQINDYSRFLERLISDGAELCHSALTLTEIANIVEKKELEIYKNNENLEVFDKKTFRKNKELRDTVIEEIKIAWSTINSMSTCLPVNLDSDFAENTISVLEEGVLDAYDSFFVQVMKNCNIDCLVTDDDDFCSINNQIVITANKKAIKNN
jgi:predicted nucleic acid-binding protein